MRMLVLTGAACLLSACATMPATAVHTLTTPFSDADLAWSKGVGAASVTGQGFVQTRGGEPRTCAGNGVILVPDSAYMRERIAFLYGNTSRAFNPNPRKVDFTPSPPNVNDYVRQTTCDAQGNFTFTGLPSGKYYVVTHVMWTVPVGRYTAEPQGGALMQSVELGNGESERVILSP